MSRAVPPEQRRVRATVVVGVCLGLLVGALPAPVVANDLPPCSDDQRHECRLPDWSAADARAIPSLFGEIDGVVWVEDVIGEARSDGLDIVGVGVGRVDIDDPAPIRDSERLLKAGPRKKAVRSGPGTLVRVVLDRAADEVAGGHSSVHVATDIDGSRSDNAPTGVATPDNPFAGSGDVYSVTWASTTGQTTLHDTELAGAWYGDDDPFAAAWASPEVLDILVPPQGFGDGFRVLTHVAGEDGGYDSVALGPAAIPSDGRVGLVADCVEGSISTQPFVVRRLVENGQTLRDVEAPASWRGGASIPVDGAISAGLEAFVEAADDDGDGRVDVAATISLFEDGVIIRQRPGVVLALDGDRALLALELGLTRRGYNVLRDFELATTGDPALDDWLERATDALSQTMPPFRSGKKAGLVAGEGIGACIPWLEPMPMPEPVPAASAAPDDADTAGSA